MPHRLQRILSAIAVGIILLLAAFGLSVLIIIANI